MVGDGSALAAISVKVSTAELFAEAGEVGYRVGSFCCRLKWIQAFIWNRSSPTPAACTFWLIALGGEVAASAFALRLLLNDQLGPCL